MKVLVISDSHGNYEIIQKVLKIEKDIDVYIHLGDYEIPEYLLNNFILVKGNCDYISKAPLSRIIEINNFKIYLEHGINFTRTNFKEEYIKNTKADIFLFGHTHTRFANKIENIYIFNPGSISKPRDNNLGTYLILNLNNDKTINYEFKEINL